MAIERSRFAVQYFGNAGEFSMILFEAINHAL